MNTLEKSYFPLKTKQMKKGKKNSLPLLTSEFLDSHADSEMLTKKRMENRVGKKSLITYTDFVSVFFHYPYWQNLSLREYYMKIIYNFFPRMYVNITGQALLQPFIFATIVTEATWKILRTSVPFLLYFPCFTGSNQSNFVQNFLSSFGSKCTVV